MNVANFVKPVEFGGCFGEARTKTEILGTLSC
jgi:hypothetical protein